MDDSDNEEEFLPMRPPGVSSMNNSMTSTNMSMDGSMTASSVSSKSSMASSAARHQKTHRHGSSSVDDQSAETSQFHLRLSSVALVLLHENILTSGIEGYGLTNASAKAMKNTAEEFFSKLGIITATGYGNKDFERASELLTESCQLSHLRYVRILLFCFYFEIARLTNICFACRLLAAPLVIEASEKTTGQRSALSGQLTLASLELVECLFETPSGQVSAAPEATIIHLLSFVRNSATATTGFSNRTDFQMKFSHTERAVRHGQTTKYCHPRTEFE